LGQFGLTLAAEKTHKTNMGARTNNETHERRRLTFLGFTIYRTRSVGQTVIKTVFQTEGKRYGRAKAALKERLRRMKHELVEEQTRAINQIPRVTSTTTGSRGMRGRPFGTSRGGSGNTLSRRGARTGD
jgi:hypothetical protein